MALLDEDEPSLVMGKQLETESSVVIKVQERIKEFKLGDRVAYIREEFAKVC